MDTKAGAFWKCLLFCAILHKTIAASAVLCPFFGHWEIVIAVAFAHSSVFWTFLRLSILDKLCLSRFV